MKYLIRSSQKFKKDMKSFYLSLILMILPVALIGQIGINTLTPDSSAVLHINGDDSRGILLPEMSRNVRETAITKNKAKHGLLVFDNTENLFYYFNDSVDKWLPVSGTPIGGIIMWSGKTAPDGWQLCDGTNITEGPLTGNSTPNLSNRFIVSYGSSYPDPGNISEGGNNNGSTGGNSNINLSVAQLPSHNHSITIDNNSHTHTLSVSATSRMAGAHSHTVDGANSVGNNHIGFNKTKGNSNQDMTSHSSGDHNHIIDVTSSIDDREHTHTATIGFNGSGGSIDIRPPYYVLAFIMRIY